MKDNQENFRSHAQAQPEFTPDVNPHTKRQLTWAYDCRNTEPPRWIVKGVIAENNLIVCYGAPKSTKSFITLDLAYHVGMGRDWCGRKVQQGGVLIVCAERSAVTKRRLDALQSYYDEGAPPVAIVDGSFSLFSTQRDLQDVIDAGTEVISKAGSLRIIIIDTLAKANAGADDVHDMPKMLGPIAKIQGAFPEAAVVAIHHTNAQEGSRKMRGRSDLRGAIDGALFVEKLDGEVSSATLLDSNDAAKPFEVFYRIEGVKLGTDEDGEEFSSGVVAPFDKPSIKAKTKPLTGQKEIAFEALIEAISQHGFKGNSSNYPGHLKIVRVSVWKDEFFRRNVSESDKPDTLGRAFRRATEYLQNRDMVRVYNDFAWVVDKPDNCRTKKTMSGDARPDGH